MLNKNQGTKMEYLLEKADYILTLDKEYVNKALRNYLREEFNELHTSGNANVERYRNTENFHDFVSKKCIIQRESFFWESLFRHLGFALGSNVYIETIPDYDELRSGLASQNYSSNWENLMAHGVYSEPELYCGISTNLSNYSYLKNGVYFTDYRKLGEFGYYNNGSMEYYGADEPWYCLICDYHKVSMTNKAYLVSNKNYLDLTILFEDTDSAFQPEGVKENNNWINYSDLKFHGSVHIDRKIKLELDRLFYKKQFQNLHPVFEDMFNRDFDVKIDAL